MTKHLEARDGTQLHLKDWGTGTPVVLVHGWPLNSDMWEYQSRVLASSGCRVVTYDRRGFGRSGQPWTGYDYDTMASDLAVVLDTLELERAVLVGFSMGGGEVVCYLAGGSQRAAKAVLVSSVSPFLMRTNDNPTGLDKSVFDTMVEGIEADRPGFLETFGKQFFGVGLLSFSVSNAMLAWSQRMALQASPKATLDCVRAFSETDFRTDCAKIRVPTLIIHGDADKTVPIECSSRETVRLIAGSTLLEYAGAPHALFYTERDRLNADLLNFING